MTNQQRKIILYARPGCPMLPPVEAMLKAAEVNYEYINIWQDERARERVRRINDGYESVPTLLFPDGSTLTEPKQSALIKKLNQFGYEIEASQAFIARVTSQIRNPFAYIRLLAFALILYGVLSTLGII